MNKIFKYLMGVFIIGIGIINTTNAEVITYSNGGGGSITANSNFTINPNSCVLFTNPTCVNKAKFYDNNNNEITTNKSTYALICNTYNTDITYQNTNSSSCVTYYFSGLLTQIQDLKTCQTCEEQYTSLQCQTEYNLIPINDVTTNYCKLNFDLIEPTECPNIGEGTGEINRTAWYINNVQYPGTASLKIDIADFLEYSTTYNSGETLVDIIGVDADEDYIEDVIAKTQITPTKEDFSVLINGLQEFLPYIMIALLMSFFILLVKKVFK